KVAVALIRRAPSGSGEVLLTIQGVNSPCSFRRPDRIRMRPACLIVTLAALGLTACAHEINLPPVTAYAETPYALDSGDKLRVVVSGQDGLSNSYTVDAAGKVTMPLIGAVPARGHTPAHLAGEITAKLKNGYVREPHVAVEIEAYRPFFILGEVTYP